MYFEHYVRYRKWVLLISSYQKEHSGGNDWVKQPSKFLSCLGVLPDDGNKNTFY